MFETSVIVEKRKVLTVGELIGYLEGFNKETPVFGDLNDGLLVMHERSDGISGICITEIEDDES